MDYNLERGDEISTMLQREIQESKLSVGFFSKNYANSCWCLEELVKILESKKMNGQMVVPIFYDIDPSIAFAKHEKQLWGDMNRVQRWRSGCLVNSDTDLNHGSSERVDLCDNFLGYEFMHHGSLENHLFRREGRPVLDWANLKIAAGNLEIVHRDFKSSNILLDNKFEAQVSDLGLVKLALDANVRPLSWYTRLKVMIGAARGLNFLHSLEKNVTYRDFKPSNIRLDKASEPRKILQLENKSSLALLGIKREQNIQTCMEQLRITNAELLNYGRIHCSLTSLVLNRAIGDSTTDQLPLDCDWKKISQLQEKSTVVHVRVKIKNRIEEPQEDGHNWRKYGQKETVQRVSSFVTTAIVFLMLIYHIFIQVEKEEEHDPVFPLLEPFGFMMFIWAIATMIVVGAPFSGLLTAMLFFWAILMLLISAKSLIALYLPISGIIFVGWHMLMEKQSPNEE